MDQRSGLLKKLFGTTCKCKSIKNQRDLLFKMTVFCASLPVGVGLTLGAMGFVTNMNVGLCLSAAFLIAGFVATLWLIICRPHHFPGPGEFTGRNKGGKKKMKEYQKKLELGIPDKKKPRSISERDFKEGLLKVKHLNYKNGYNNFNEIDIEEEVIDQITIPIFNKQYLLSETSRESSKKKLNDLSEEFCISSNKVFVKSKLQSVSTIICFN